MNIHDTRKIILSYFETNCLFSQHTHGKILSFNGKTYQIRPDDAFYYPDNILVIEYENNLRPVESISKYLWLFKKSNWVREALKINLLLTINNQRIEKDYKIRTESIQILGDELKRQYPLMFNFCFINYSNLNEEKLIKELHRITNQNR